jgi:excisionase family DNA binding protein
MKKEYITTSELAKFLGISRVAVFKRIKAGKIKAEKIGRNYVISQKELPKILGNVLAEDEKITIKEAVKKTVDEYGQTLKLLGKE